MVEMAEMVTVSVTVPSQSVSALYTYAAELVADADTESAAAAGADGSGHAGNKWGFGKGSVKKAYLGGVSEHWRPFLEELAHNRDEWVAWPELCAAIGLTPKQASGMLGAGERRCKGRPPYEKTYEGGTYFFRMPAKVADVVEELAAAG